MGQYGYGSGDARVSALVDMINGGGAGRAGQQFEGGGLLSMLGNMLTQPYGAAAQGTSAPDTSLRPVPRPQGRPQGLGTSAPDTSLRPVMRPPQPTPQPTPTGLSPFEMFGGQPPAPYTGLNLQYSGRGTVGMPYPAWVQDDATRQIFDYLRAQGVQGY